MADARISQLPVATTVESQDIVPFTSISASETRRITANNLAKRLTQLGLTVGTTAPSGAYNGQLWVDTSTNPPLLKVYNGATFSTVSFLPGSSILTSPGGSAPSSPALGQLWLDTSQTPDELKVYDGANFVRVDPLGITDTAAALKYLQITNAATTYLEFTKTENQTLLGDLTLKGLPTTDNMAANKKYVDDEITTATNGFLPTSGGTLVGRLYLFSTNTAVGTPSLAFNGDTDTGIGRPEANFLDIIAGGQARIRASNTQVSVNPATLDVDFRVAGYQDGNLIHTDAADNTVYLGKATRNGSGATYTSAAKIDVFQNYYGHAIRGENRSNADFFQVHANKAASNPAAQYIMPIRVGTSSNVRGAIYWNSGTSQILFQSYSDYRVKENVADVVDAIADLKRIRPVTFNFIDNASSTQAGFIAHELQEVVPVAVGGEKDAVDGDGEPILQGVDPGKVVPLLTAALQEAVAKIEALETRIAALEG